MAHKADKARSINERKPAHFKYCDDFKDFLPGNGVPKAAANYVTWMNRAAKRLGREIGPAELSCEADAQKLLAELIQIDRHKEGKRFIKNPLDEKNQLSTFRKYVQMVESNYRGLFSLSKPIDSEIISDIEKIKSSTANPTAIQALVNARVGQGQFGTEVRRIWSNCCSVTRSCTAAVLEASHIKRWAESNDTERLDPQNGLLLTANLHKLFDAGLISFDDEGKMLISSRLSKAEQKIFGISGKKLLQKPSMETARYLAFHRSKFIQ